MFTKLFLQAENREYIKQKYAHEVVNLCRQMDNYVAKKISFIHPKDMERCATEVDFTGDWTYVPFGDPEWTWVLNRHRFIEELGRAYFITQEDRYLQSMFFYLENWIDNNPNSENKTGGSWRRIDTGIRICHWIRGLELINFKIPSTLLTKIQQSLIIQGKYLAQNISGFSQTSNWGVLEFHGLFHLSLFYPHELSTEWLELSKNFLIKSIDTQVLADGNHWECSPMYHNEVLFSYLYFLLMSKRQEIEIPLEFQKKVHQMALCNIKWQKPNYKQPLWGDSDDTDIRDINTLSAYLFEDTHLKNRAHPECDFENYFILGDQGSSIYQNILSKEPDFCSAFLEESGFLCLRDSWREKSSFLNFYTKKFGAGHNHDDLLHVSFFANKQDYLIDCGRYTYVESKERKHLKGSLGHNTIILNHQDNSIYLNSWDNSKEASFLPGQYLHKDGIDWAYAHNLSYLNKKSLITRNVIRFDGRNFVIVDSIIGEGKKHIELKFNTPCSVTKKKQHYFFDDLLFIPDTSVTTEMRDSYYSLHYNEKSMSTQCVCSITTVTNTALISGFSFDEMQIHSVDLYTRLGDLIPIDKAIAWKIQIKEEEYILLYRLTTEINTSTRFIGFDNSYYIQAKVLLKKQGDRYHKILQIAE